MQKLTPGRCPNCGSIQITWHSEGVDLRPSGHAFVVRRCPRCGCVWDEEYTLTGYEQIYPNRDAEIRRLEKTVTAAQFPPNFDEEAYTLIHTMADSDLPADYPLAEGMTDYARDRIAEWQSLIETVTVKED